MISYLCSVRPWPLNYRDHFFALLVVVCCLLVSVGPVLVHPFFLPDLLYILLVFLILVLGEMSHALTFVLLSICQSYLLLMGDKFCSIGYYGVSLVMFVPRR